MKKTIAFLSSILLFASVHAGAQNVALHFGILGGLTYDWTGSTPDMKNMGLPGWHGGLALELKLPMYFALQAGAQYEMGHSNILIDSFGGIPLNNELKIHRISVPVALQWGPDLGVVRPFVQMVPLFNFNFDGKYKDIGDDNVWKSAKKYLNPFQFGLGLGLGIELWKIQLSARYNWIFGDWRQNCEGNPFTSNKSISSGVTFSAGFFF